MAGSFNGSKDDPIDISELASLNQDISDDLLSELENKLSTDATSFKEEKPVNINDDSTLFEEPVTELPVENNHEAEANSQSEDVTETKTNEEQTPEELPVAQEEQSDENKETVKVNQAFDDNFIKKYKAKLNKKAQASLDNGKSVNGKAPTKYMQEQEQEGEPIEALSNGNISERPLTQETKEYNESLDFLDGNIKYSKYVIYIEPKNVDFIDGLTVKERKNLINNILRQQDDISITKQRFALIQTIIRQVIIAIITIAVSIPVIYYVINASLEATVDNYRRSQVNWQNLYKQHGKIQNMK